VDAYSHIAELFHRRIDCIAAAVDALAPGLETAAEKLTETVLADRKIIVCGVGVDATLAEHIAAEHRAAPNEGPNLPAIGRGAQEPPDDLAPLWRDLRTLARDGDVLLSIDSSDDGRFAGRCADFARQRNLLSVAMSEPREQPMGVCVVLRASDPVLRSELALMACHGLLEQVRQHLLGE
jgi:D-sedoheptulose 7-phosphate isomerase